MDYYYFKISSTPIFVHTSKLICEVCKIKESIGRLKIIDYLVCEDCYIRLVK